MLNTEINKETDNKLLNESLFKAAAKGSLKKVKSLIAQGADINFQDEHGASVLMQAVIHNNTKIVSLLLDLKVNVDLADKDGHTAYLKAIEYGAESFELFGKYQTDEQISDEKLIDAVRNDDINLVRYYLSNGNNPDAICYRRGESAIHLAVSNENIDVIKQLANAGADLNYISQKNSYTPLLLALRIGASISVIKTLLDLGADISLETDLGLTPLMYASRYLSLSVIRLLLESGANLNEYNDRLQTPLMLALLADREDNLSVINYLVSNGADVNRLDDCQNTILMYLADASGSKQTCESLQKCARLLVDKGVNIDAQNIDEESALFIASKNNNIDALSALIELGADVSLLNMFGESALMLAGSKSRNHSLTHKTIKILLENGADVSAQGPAGLTPIQYHAFNFDSTVHDIKIISLLIEAGADIHHKNEDNESLVDIVNAGKDKQLKSYFQSIQLKEYLNDSFQDELNTGDTEEASNRLKF